MEIKATKRDITGRKVKTIRSNGQIPASVYGPKREARSLSVDSKELRKVYEESGLNKFISLTVESEAKPVQVLIKEMQIDPLTDGYLHVSFFAIDPNKRIVADVPVVVKGASPAVKNNVGFLVTPIELITLRCLPKDLPESIVINIDSLEEIGDNISLEDVKLASDVEFASLTDMSTSIAYIAPPQKEIEEEEPVVEEEVEGEEGEEGVEGEEGEEGVEGEEAKDPSAGSGQGGKEGAEVKQDKPKKE